MRHHLVVRELWPSDGSSARIADHRSKITNDEHGFMAQVLELPKFSQDNGVTEMDIGAGRIDTELDAKWAVERKLLTQFLLADDLGCALFQQR